MAKTVGTGAHLTDTQLRAWTGLLDTARILDSEIENNLRANFALTHREYEVLVRLDGAGGSMRMSMLARRIEASAALVTQTVAKLEERSWVERISSKADARGIEAALTAQGRAALAKAAKSHAALIERLLLQPLDGSLEVVADSLTIVADHLRGHRTGAECADESCPMNH
jgi:DNA-binding MarR family transcriptional regulator